MDSDPDPTRANSTARVEGIIPGPEPTHAVASAMNEVMKGKESGEEKVILFNLSGHGHFDMSSYQAYFNDELVDYEHPGEAIRRRDAGCPGGRRLTASKSLLCRSAL